MADKATNQKAYFQFYGAVDIPKTQYREFRVKTETLADIPTNQCTSKSFTDGIKNVTEEHNQAILDLRKQIRVHEEMNTKWQQLKKLPDGSTKDLVNRLLQSGIDGIRQFEEDNFRSNHDWARTKKATDGVHLKSMLLSLNEFDGDGNPVYRHEEVDAKSEKVTSAPAEKSINGEDSTIALEPVPKIDGVETETSKPEDGGRNDRATEVSVEKEDQRKDNSKESVNVKQDQTPPNENKPAKTVSPMKKGTSNANHGQSSSKETPHVTEDRPVVNSKTPSTDEDVIVSSLDSPNGTPPVSKNFELCEELMKHWQDPAPSEVVDTNTAVEKKKAKILKEKILALTSLLDPSYFRDLHEVDKFRSIVRKHTISKYQMADIQEQDEESEDQLGPLEVGNGSRGNGNSSNERNRANERRGIEDSAAEDEEIAEVNDSDNTHSEKSFHTAKTSVSPDSANHEKLDESVNAPSTSSCPGPSSNKKKGKKSKRNKKSNKGPKITQEEVQAIKKQKKAETDREFERVENERKNHLRKVENNEKSKLFRQTVQTAIEMASSNDRVPEEITTTEKNLKEFSENNEMEDLIPTRNKYLERRAREFAEDLSGTELTVKMELLEIYQHEIERAQKLCQYFMFLTILDEKSYDYSDFEFAILRFFFIGYEEDMHPNVQDVFRRFNHFLENVCQAIPEYDLFINAVIYVREKLMLLSDMAERYNITRSEVILREGYCGIAQVLENMKKVTELTAFLESSKDSTEPSFGLIETWILETKCPKPYSCNV